ncbi:SdpI family protein [Ruminococcus sp. CLA-AA-H200]|uniref:SdpI family protein n=1 Tax=Ruminococcus turbiniformis TaxID=2881258 RepID=A0ABS8G321_9FIRM|nr:SdpI family protein [Ruminococcus turbiniformis]MCC2255329.1 SdpI family protein [Ruminococcus turbiniformis]
MKNVKTYGKTVIITTLITLLPIVIGLILWDRLPDTIATHWGADGEANGWSDKAHAVFFLPCMLAVIHLIAAAVVLADPKRKNIHRKPMMLTLWIVPVISLITNGSTYVIALGADLNMSVFLCLVIGIVFILLGNYMPKLQQNYTVGIKVPWTLNSEENWNRTHRLAGKMFVLGGIIIAVSGFISTFAGDSAVFLVMVAIAIICCLIPAGYSFWLFKKGI